MPNSPGCWGPAIPVRTGRTRRPRCGDGAIRFAHLLPRPDRLVGCWASCFLFGRKPSCPCAPAPGRTRLAGGAALRTVEPEFVPHDGGIVRDLCMAGQKAGLAGILIELLSVKPQLRSCFRSHCSPPAGGGYLRPRRSRHLLCSRQHSARRRRELARLYRQGTTVAGRGTWRRAGAATPFQPTVFMNCAWAARQCHRRSGPARVRCRGHQRGYGGVSISQGRRSCAAASAVLRLCRERLALYGRLRSVAADICRDGTACARQARRHRTTAGAACFLDAGPAIAVRNLQIPGPGFIAPAFVAYLLYRFSSRSQAPPGNPLVSPGSLADKTPRSSKARLDRSLSKRIAQAPGLAP